MQSVERVNATLIVEGSDKTVTYKIPDARIALEHETQYMDEDINKYSKYTSTRFVSDLYKFTIEASEMTISQTVKKEVEYVATVELSEWTVAAVESARLRVNAPENATFRLFEKFEVEFVEFRWKT